MTDVSVVVCTRGRPALLRRALESLEAQTLPRASYEVIVVDNGDGVGEAVAAELRADQVLREPHPGLSRARNLGWGAARSELVGFLDDDAEADRHWLERALTLAAERNAAVVGGPILTLYDDPPPSWFRDEYEQRTWGSQDRVLLPGESLSGSNVFIRRGLLEALGGFDERLGMRGTAVAVGEETALFEALWRTGDVTVVYSPSLVVRHRVAPEKLSALYQLRRAAAAGGAWATRQDLDGAARLRRGAADLLAAVVLGARALVHLRRPVRRWAVDELAAAAARLGSFRGLWR